MVLIHLHFPIASKDTYTQMSPFPQKKQALTASSVKQTKKGCLSSIFGQRDNSTTLRLSIGIVVRSLLWQSIDESSLPPPKTLIHQETCDSIKKRTMMIPRIDESRNTARNPGIYLQLRSRNAPRRSEALRFSRFASGKRWVAVVSLQRVVPRFFPPENCGYNLDMMCSGKDYL